MPPEGFDLLMRRDRVMDLELVLAMYDMQVGATVAGLGHNAGPERLAVQEAAAIRGRGPATFLNSNTDTCDIYTTIYIGIYVFYTI